MIRILSILTFLACASCQTASKKSQPQQYTVQLMEIAVPSSRVEWPEQLWAMNPSHFKKDTVKDNATQYIGVKQLVDGENFLKDQQTRYTDAQVASAAVEKMMKMPDTIIAEFTEINLSEGEQVIDDQTKITELPGDYDVVDGKAVVSYIENFRSGQSVDIQLIEVEDSILTYNLKLYIGRLTGGFDTMTLPSGYEIKVPLTGAISANTLYAQPFDTWNVVGCLAHELIEGGQTNETSHLFCIRLISTDSVD